VSRILPIDRNRLLFPDPLSPTITNKSGNAIASNGSTFINNLLRSIAEEHTQIFLEGDQKIERFQIKLIEDKKFYPR
jgi:hypothetical protein